MLLSDGVTDITLPDSLEWTDEFDFTPVGQQVDRTIGGSLIVQESALKKGRPITLEGGEFVWAKREAILKVQTFASVPGKKMKLTLADGSQFDVIFKRDSGSPFSAKPVQRKNVQDPEHQMNMIVLKFYEVEK